MIKILFICHNTNSPPLATLSLEWSSESDRKAVNTVQKKDSLLFLQEINIHLDS